ncbi:6,7-dimethyl-8-ribityllumazine synthase [Rhodohalobacter sp. SW132]|uniref:6,7-dimethyl-8-ribityllumazine synthase n=1 Tax=Rhodohalobacter sp. SW132 TaxID=2293433 RepID=UPI000E27F5A3|nr:6,7-dimethyl-8-ribityllumazine synthase [Rhodohalobacter sp. SW132]REL33365.1 6,7-dimethyl-8-ribityllumazine synthase [Rhodohalobacter sp. SW132]
MDWKKKRIAVVAAKWNSFVTDDMLEGAVAALKGKGIPDNQIFTYRCPGSYELPLACKMCIDELNVDGVVAIGAVIKGGTPHFHYVCDAVNKGIAELNIRYGLPVSFGVLTTDNVEQAMERAGIDKGNKGAEAALAVCDMLELSHSVKNSNS